MEQIAAGALGRRQGEVGLALATLRAGRRSTARSPPRRRRRRRPGRWCRWHQRSISALAGPQSKPSTAPSAPQQRQVGDAAEVEHGDASRPARPNSGAVEGRHQRRALAAGRHVAAAEVGDHVDAGQLGQQRGVVELQRVARAVELLRAGGARSGHARRWRAPLSRRAPAAASSASTTVGIDAGQRIGGQRGAVQFVGAAACSAPAARRAVPRRRRGGRAHEHAAADAGRRSTRPARRRRRRARCPTSGRCRVRHAGHAALAAASPTRRRAPRRRVSAASSWPRIDRRAARRSAGLRGRATARRLRRPWRSRAGSAARR